MKKLLTFSMLMSYMLLMFMACGGDSQSQSKNHDGHSHTQEENTQDNKHDHVSIKDKLTTLKTYIVTPMSSSPTYENAVIEEMTYKNGRFNFIIPVGEYRLGEQTSDAEIKMCANSNKGQHIHLIVDNEPYSAQYTSSFDYKISDGSHYLLAFLSRSYHESIKDDLAARAVKVKIINNSIKSEETIEEPMLFYSRPKGTYTGRDTKEVMLDFYMVGTNMDNHYVLASINGENVLLTEWVPYIIENLPMGENEIVLTLVDHEGNTVDAPLNPTKRIFTLESGS